MDQSDFDNNLHSIATDGSPTFFSPSGRIRRHPHITRADIIETFQHAFEIIGGLPRLALWADQNPDDFFKLYGRLLPSASTTELDGPQEMIIRHVLPPPPPPMQKVISHNYQPRAIFYEFHRRLQRWAIMVVHRRGGKTVAAVNDTVARILHFTSPPPSPLTGDPVTVGGGRFAYIAPFLKQAKEVAWDYVKYYTRSMLKKPPNESELSVMFFNDCKFTLYGADNPDSFRGQYFDGVVMDEYGMMRPSVWSEIILPALIDRSGWATFIGTPKGPNHFRTLVRRALADPARWFIQIWPVSKTKLVPQAELDEMKKLMMEEEYLQEMECSFEASARGAFYSKEIMTAEQEGRVTTLLPNKDLPLHFVYDLGYRDDTATIAFQDALDGYPILHAEADNLRPIRHYIRRINEICSHFDVPRGHIWLPHDAKAKSLQTGRSIVEQFLAAEIRPELVPFLDVQDGIAAARMLFPEIYFNEPATVDLVEALKTYRREWDDEKKAFKNRPVEDWSVHYADTFRYFALVAQKEHPHTIPSPPPAPTASVGTTTAHYPLTLEQLWSTLNASPSRRIL